MVVRRCPVCDRLDGRPTDGRRYLCGCGYTWSFEFDRLVAEMGVARAVRMVGKSAARAAGGRQ